MIKMIVGEYTLFTRILLFKNENNEFYTNELWEKDLALHFDYIENLNICCPVVNMDEDDGSLVHVRRLTINNVNALKKDYGHFSVMRNFIPNFFSVMGAARKSDIVHSDGAGWAFPLSFYLLFCSLFMNFKWIVGIESSFWALEPGEKFNLRLYLRHHVHVWFLGRCLRKADARMFTHAGYRDMFLQSDDRTLVAPATWINESDIQPISRVKSNLITNNARMKILYPTRLIEVKGVLVVLDAIKKLQEDQIKIDITIMGDGPLYDYCQKFSEQINGSVNVSVKSAVEYGEPFFSVVREHDLILIANLKDEQPRIVFDAFCQGVGVVAPNTNGIRSVVDGSKAVSLFDTGDASSLASTLEHLSDNINLLAEMGHNGLKHVVGKTHKKMHEEREIYLLPLVNE